MRGPFLLILAVGLTPLLVFGLIVTFSGLGLARWEPPVMWATQFGTPNAGNGVTATTTGTNRVYVAGYLNDSSAHQDVEPNVFVASYDLSGHLIWIQQLERGIFSSEIRSIATGADGVYIAGFLNGSAFVRKYDFGGSQVWTNTLGGLDSETLSVSVGLDGVYAGAVGSTNMNGMAPFFMREYDFKGGILWTISLGIYQGRSVGLFVAPGAVYATSSDTLSFASTNATVSKYASNSTLLWTRQLNNPPDLHCTCESDWIAGDSTGIYVAGYTYFSPTAINAFLVRFDSNGNRLWTVQTSSPDHSTILGVAMSASLSGAYLSVTTGAGHQFVMRYDNGGNLLWSVPTSAFGSARTVNVVPIAAGPDDFFIGGSIRVDGGSDAYVAEFSQSSSLILFGLTPPFSFTLAGLLVGTVAIGILFVRKRNKGKSRPRSANIDYSPKASIRT